MDKDLDTLDCASDDDKFDESDVIGLSFFDKDDSSISGEGDCRCINNETCCGCWIQ